MQPSPFSFAAAAVQLEDGTYLYGDGEARPAPVMALQDCAANERTPASRRPFAGGYIFAIKCASNHANYVETLIFSEHADGADARLLLFPGPGHPDARANGGGVAAIEGGRGVEVATRQQ